MGWKGPKEDAVSESKSVANVQVRKVGILSGRCGMQKREDMRDIHKVEMIQEMNEGSEVREESRMALRVLV